MKRCSVQTLGSVTGYVRERWPGFHTGEGVEHSTQGWCGLSEEGILRSEAFGLGCMEVLKLCPQEALLKFLLKYSASLVDMVGARELIV